MIIMKIAIPESGGQVNPHFGRSTSFTVVEIDKDQVVDVETVSAVGLQHNHEGVAALLKEKEVTIIIAGGIGAGMIEALESQGFEVLRGASGSVKMVAETYARGDFVSKGSVCDHHHHDQQH